MDITCSNESTTSDTISTVAPAPSPVRNCSELYRVRSGCSAVLDLESSEVEAESRKLPSSRFKGVVPQPNGRWGAQIYEKHQRVWLGTFNEEEQAAKAYDVAVLRFRGRDAVTNFKPAAESEPDESAEFEASFLNSHSKAEIVDMLRKHTYDDELEQSKRSSNGKNEFLGQYGCGQQQRVVKARVQLFEKTVTPSDVGKLNRLVIPKQHAEKHFPLQNGSTSKGVLLNFEDNGMKVWRFRYSYWNSSQSYVLTKGWSRFVKEKGLKAGDIVSFLRSTEADKQLFIDWKARNVSTTANVDTVSGPLPFRPVQVEPVEMVRLFGVNIFKVPISTIEKVDNKGDGHHVVGSCNGKRIREMEILGLDCVKKQRRVIDAL